MTDRQFSEVDLTNIARLTPSLLSLDFSCVGARGLPLLLPLLRPWPGPSAVTHRPQTPSGSRGLPDTANVAQDILTLKKIIRCLFKTQI